MTRVQRGRANRLDPALTDGLLAGCLVVMGVVGLLLGTGGRVVPDGSESPTALAWLLMLGQGLPVAWRRKAPLATLAVVELATVAYFLLHFPPTGAALGVLVAFYTVAARYPLRVVLPFAGLLAAGVLTLTGQGRMPFEVFVLLHVLFASAWIMGHEQLARHAYAALVDDRAARLERELGYLAREAVADERVRISRELHQSVTEGVRAMAAQAQAAKLSLPRSAGSARHALAVIERTAERTLGELARGFEVLGPGEPVAAVEPQAGPSQLSALVTEVKLAGLPVDVKVEGDAVPLSTEVDSSAYRIVQEALSSCLKRPGQIRPQLVIRYGRQDLELQVTDDRNNGAWLVDPGQGRYQSLGWMQPRPADQEQGPDGWLEGSYGVLARLPLHSAHPRPV
jgi:signal transduction histidine kinase